MPAKITGKNITDRNPLQQLKSKASRAWFMKNVRTLRNINVKKDILSQGGRAVHNLRVGSIYMYVYDPKTKKQLPYYDRLPLMIVLNYNTKSFVGLNLHYLPMRMRELLLQNMLDLVNNTKYDRTTRMLATYDILKSARRYKYIKPCVKRYLYSHVKSNIIKITPAEWSRSIYLPVERFKKESKEQVWIESIQRIKNG